MNELDLMRVRADTLFAHNAAGRMIASNEPSGRPAPRLFLERTTGGYVFRFGEAVSDRLAEELSARIARLPLPGDPCAPVPEDAALRVALEREAPVVREGGGPAYRFPALAPGTPFTRGTPGPTGATAIAALSDDLAAVDEGNAWLLRWTFPGLDGEIGARQPCFAVVQDGAAVSVCFSSRVGTRATEAGLETLPHFRGRGFAVAVTAAWGAAVSRANLIPLYSTSWDNLASQAVARRLGLVLFGADASWS